MGYLPTSGLVPREFSKFPGTSMPVESESVGPAYESWHGFVSMSPATGAVFDTTNAVVVQEVPFRAKGREPERREVGRPKLYDGGLDCVGDCPAARLRLCAVRDRRPS